MQNELDIVRDVSKKLNMTDMPPEIAEMVRHKLMARSAEERFIMGIRMFDAAPDVILASFPADISKEDLKRKLFKRIYGEPLPF